jgi:hypothetical protein
MLWWLLAAAVACRDRWFLLAAAAAAAAGSGLSGVLAAWQQLRHQRLAGLFVMAQPPHPPTLE